MPHMKKSLYVVLLGILFAGCGHEETTTRSGTDTHAGRELTFTAAVKNVTMLSRYEGEVRSVGVDPQWVIELEVKEPPKDSPEYRDISGTVAFAVHSPTKVFMGDTNDVVGESFKFLLVTSKEKDEQVKYKSLSIIPLEE